MEAVARQLDQNDNQARTFQVLDNIVEICNKKEELMKSKSYLPPFLLEMQLLKF